VPTPDRRARRSPAAAPAEDGVNAFDRVASAVDRDESAAEGGASTSDRGVNACETDVNVAVREAAGGDG